MFRKIHEPISLSRFKNMIKGAGEGYSLYMNTLNGTRRPLVSVNVDTYNGIISLTDYEV